MREREMVSGAESGVRGENEDVDPSPVSEGMGRD